MENIIYNLIVMINSHYDNLDIDYPEFIKKVCVETGLSEAEYKRIMEVE